MPDTYLDTLAYDFATAKRVATLLNGEGVPAQAEEFEIGMAHIRLDPEEHDPTGYIAMATDTDDGGTTEGGWVMIPTAYHEDMHTYEVIENSHIEALGMPVDADPEDVAEAIENFLA